MSTPPVALVGGLVADGFGGAPVHADVLLRDGLVEAVVPVAQRPESGYDAQTVDAEGKIVAPGFVDLHCHSDLSLLAYPDNESRVTQGVTSEVVGNCGMSPAPTGGDSAGLAAVIATIDVVPGSPRPWADVAGWLDVLDSTPTATNVAALVGHGSARFAVAGAEGRPLTEPELSRLAAEIDDAMEAGCVGASLGLMYAPGEGASAEELRRVAAAVAARDGLLAAHVRHYEPHNILTGIDEFTQGAASTGVRMQVSHLRTVGGGGGFEEAVAHIEALREQGIDIAADTYPYVAGHATLIQLLPPELRVRGPQAVLDAIDADPHAIATQLSQCGSAPEDITIMKAARTPEVVGLTLDELPGDPWQRLTELLRDNDALVDVAVVGSRWSDVDLAMRTPWISICSDGTALNASHTSSAPHPRSWGAFSGGYRRMRDLGIAIEEAVHRMSVAPAHRAGLESGLRSGLRADVVVFDDARFDARATYREPAAASTALDHVFVGGTAVLTDGKTTGARPGRLLRRKGGQ